MKMDVWLIKKICLFKIDGCRKMLEFLVNKLIIYVIKNLKVIEKEKQNIKYFVNDIFFF